MHTHPLGYIIIRVQVDGVGGYDEDQTALIIWDSSKFALTVPVACDDWKGHQCNKGKQT